ncbi:CLUMA_CG016162, isoform A [Clunio marinus]|uniref:CLUMA_CG016162, isoform A n=1 Tax=Clunio marinus TaxID=568069 RepID=A0A1J1ISP1_9DIPT|nr:CLUMA_CG016162, isoform A [Clunio marinus]
MFGAIVSGRLVQTDFQQIEETKLLLNIPDADNLNHLVIFLTGTTPLPLGTAGAVYWSWPDPNSPSKWQYLGYISNQKPSAIFKISQLKKLHEMETHDSMMMFGQSAISHNAQIGISIEPEATVVQQTPSTTNDASSYYQFGQRMLENFVNFASSFTITQSQMVPNPSETYVPLSTLTTWFNNFQRRLEQNPNFWK